MDVAIRLWTELTGSVMEVKDIASLAKGGDTQALQLFEQTGEHPGTLLSSHLQDLRPPHLPRRPSR